MISPLSIPLGKHPEWVLETLGIRERHIAEPEEYTSDLAARAGLDAIASADRSYRLGDFVMVYCGIALFRVQPHVRESEGCSPL